MENIEELKYVPSGTRKLDVIMARLRTGSAGVGQYLFKTKQLDTPYCKHCVDSIETIKHLIFDCPGTDQERMIFGRKLERLGIGQVTMKGLLVGNNMTPKRWKRVVVEFGKFLESIGRMDL